MIRFRTQIIPILFMLMGSTHTFAQQGGALKIGDRMPDITVELENYDSPILRFSDLEGKLVVLDFWGVTCIPCIKSIPAMQALQKEFGDKIQIILVTTDSEEAVNRLAMRSPIVRELNLPSIVGDTVLSQLFEYRTVPAHAWIDEHGIVSQFVSGYLTTAENITRHLNGEGLDLPTKQEHRDFDPLQSMLTEGDGRQLRHLQYYSMIMKRVTSYDGGGGGVKRDSLTDQPLGVRIVNNSISFLYGVAFGAELDNKRNPLLNSNRQILDVRDLSRFNRPDDPSLRYKWMNENIYSYESNVPIHMSDFVLKIMQEDLQRYFGYNGSVVKRKVECLVLKQVGDMSLLASGGGRSKWNLGVRDSLDIRNCPFSFLIQGLTELYGKDQRPLIFEAELPERIDISIAGDLTNLAVFREELRRYGLDLVPQKRRIEMLLITDK